MGRDERRWLFVLGVLSVAWCVGACDGKQESPPLKDQGPSPHDVLQVDGSGEGGGPLPDLRGEAAPPPLTVTSTLPVDKATEVTLSSSISVTFSRAIDPATATASSLTLVPEGLTLPPGAMSTTVSASLATATLTSAYPLCPLTTYAATATTAFADLQKNALAADYRWRFTTTDGAWSAPHVGPAASTAVAGAIGARGDVVIVWFRGGHVYAQRYDVAKASWASAVQVDLAKDGLYGRPGVAVDARGDAIVAWIQGGMQDLYAARYDVATATWSAPKALEKVGELVTDGPSVAMSPSGDAMVVFIQETPGAGTTGTAVYYATHDGKAWSARS
ncbi:MAG: Ig-like domain-containing protein, partial [Deltaproteobacteria bacterium]|nr:Ig-like domain-containing protein [Deltaproteobacteria bacterium]